MHLFISLCHTIGLIGRVMVRDHIYGVVPAHSGRQKKTSGFCTTPAFPHNLILKRVCWIIIQYASRFYINYHCLIYPLYMDSNILNVLELGVGCFPCLLIPTFINLRMPKQALKHQESTHINMKKCITKLFFILFLN